MAQPVLAARAREIKGKGAVRKLRKSHQIPAIFYGPASNPIMLTLEYKEFAGIFKESGSENIILDLEVKSERGTAIRRAMLKDLQIDPIKDTYIHADFYEISMDKEITVDVPIEFIGTPVGVTKGGVLQHIRRQLTISCLPDKLIDSLELDVSRLDIGDSLHIKDFELPEGIASEEEGHLTVAIVAAPAVAIEKEEEEVGELEEEAAEPEMKEGAEES